MKARLVSIDAQPWEVVNPSFERRLVAGERVMLAFLHLHRGSRVPRHSHHNEQLSYVESGRLRFLMGDGEDEHVVGPGQVLVIPGDLPHSVEAIEDTRGFDLFSPPRQDWLDGTDDYLRR
ncbi:MAG TPA: cupin domain-containing protein [Thermoanaerobaculia bacterium]|nr:cupin domain-containing protein [Thermoanaerobaculia bacterium]